MKKSTPVLDIAGIGIGPFNLSLAALVEPIDSLTTCFYDQRDKFDWHPGMILEGSHLQTPFMADLVTLADPTSSYSFLNYLKLTNRLYAFYIRENFYILRQEYNRYCQWVSKRLSNLQFQSKILDIQYLDKENVYQLTLMNTKNQAICTQKARKLVIGSGPTVKLPSCCSQEDWAQNHSSHYLSKKDHLQKEPSITIIGSGQSAAEIFYDLLQDIDNYNYELSWVTRSARFFPLEYSKLTLEMTSPEYTDYFHQLPQEKRASIIKSQKSLYKGINFDLINAIYDLLYIKNLASSIKVNLFTLSTLINIEKRCDQQQTALTFFHNESEEQYTHHSAGIVLATGYQGHIPQYLSSIKDRIRWNEKGEFNANRFYAVDQDQNDIFLQNAGMNTHGFVTPDLGMACYRNACIIREILGYEHYPVEKRIAFQTFGAPISIGNAKPLVRLNG